MSWCGDILGARKLRRPARTRLHGARSRTFELLNWHPPRQQVPSGTAMKSDDLSRPPPDLAPFIRPGDTVIWGQSHAEPVSLIRALVAQRERLGRIRVFLGIGVSSELAPHHADAFELLAYCGTGSNRRLT